MQQKVALAMFAILLISNIGASAPANENVLHPNIVRAMDDADANTQIEFRVNGSWHRINLIKDEYFKI